MTWEARTFSSQLYICTVQHSNWHQLGIWWTFIELNQSLTHSPSSVTSFTISLLTLWSWLFWSTWQVYGADFVEVKMNLLSGYTMVGLCISSFLWWNVISSSPFKLQPRHLPSEACLDFPMLVVAPLSLLPHLNVYIFVLEHILLFVSSHFCLPHWSVKGTSEGMEWTHFCVLSIMHGTMFGPWCGFSVS